MRLIAFGGDERMSGALAAARARGWETLHVRTREEAQDPVGADAVLLPWPRSFEKETLLGGELGRAQTLSAIPVCRAALIGSDVRAQEVPQAGVAVLPGRDETFLLKNAALTAEGALFAAHAKTGRALAGRSCLVTGFGRIGRALAARLTAMEAFVVVCARSEAQMRLAHDMGAHPVPMHALTAACAQAELVFNTVPARVLGEEALSALAGHAQLIELASAPYGADPELAQHLGVPMAIESGLPGRFAPADAGAALFEALECAMNAEQGGKQHGGA